MLGVYCCCCCFDSCCTYMSTYTFRHFTKNKLVDLQWDPWGSFCV